MKQLIAPLLIILFFTQTVAQTRETRDVPVFTKISYRVPGKLILRQGSSQKVELEGDREVLQEIETIVKNGKLVIGEENINSWFSWKQTERYKINVYITVENIDGLYVSGSGNLVAETILKSENLDLNVSGSGSMELQAEVSGDVSADISGSGDLKIKGNCRDISSQVSGSGKVYIANTIRRHARFGLSGSGKVLAAGKAESVKVTISGSGKVLAADLETDRCDVNISGSGDVEINVKSELDARITGSGSVMYKGNPNHINSHSSGSGKIRKLQS